MDLYLGEPKAYTGGIKKKRKLDIKHNDVNETNTIGKRK